MFLKEVWNFAYKQFTATFIHKWHEILLNEGKITMYYNTMTFAIQDNQQEHMEKQQHICLCLHADIYIMPISDAKHQRGTWSHENRKQYNKNNENGFI